MTFASVLAAAGVQAQPAAEPPEPAEEAESPAEPSGLGLLLAGPLLGPISSSGLLTYDFNTSGGQQTATSTSHLLTGTVNAATYLVAPWFATASGTLRLTASSSRSTSMLDGQLGPVEGASYKERFITGSLRLDLFPRARFPFHLHVERNDSRIDTGLLSPLHFQSYSVGLAQRYRPEDNSWRASASFEHRGQSAEGTKQTQNALNGDFATGWKHHQMALSASLSQARSDRGDGSSFQSLVARHTYSPESGMSVDSTVNVTRSADRYAGFASELAVLQLSSVGIWSPAEEKYTLSGAVRAALARDQETGEGSDTLGLTAGGTYVVSPNVRLSANAHVSWFHSGNTTSQALSGSAGVSWSGDSFEWNGLRYDQFASVGGGASLSSGGSTDDTRSGVQMQAGHSVSKAIETGENSQLILQMSQSLSMSRSFGSSESTHPGLGRDQTSERHLQHSASVTWTAGTANSRVYARAMLSDFRDLGGGARNQLANFQLSGTYQISNRSSLSGDLTLQRVQQVGGTLWDDGLGLMLPGTRSNSTGASGEITYRHERLFGVPRLTFMSRLKLAQDVQRQAGTFLTIPERETRMWENQLSWSIGRLQSHLLLRISEVEGRRYDHLMWRAQRSFGD